MWWTWILSFIFWISLVRAEKMNNCQLINMKGQRSLAKCLDMPTVMDWRIISGNKTQRVDLKGIKSGILTVQKDDKPLTLYVQEIAMKSMKLDGIDENFFSDLGPELSIILMDMVEIPKPLEAAHFKNMQDTLIIIKLNKGPLVEPDAFVGMRKLKELYIQNSAQRVVPSNLGDLLRNGLKDIDLDGTLIQTLPFAEIASWSSGDIGASAGVFSFDNSKLHCDESASVLAKKLQASETEANFVGFKCYSPEVHRGKNLKEISVDDLREITEEAPQVSEESFQEKDMRSTTEPLTRDIEETATANFSLVGLSILAGVFVFIVLIIVVAIVVKYHSNSKHTSVKQTEDPSKAGLLPNGNNNPPQQNV